MLLFLSFGCSAMSKCIESGMLVGCTFGGVVTLINNRLRKIVQTVHCDERFSIVIIADVLIVNVFYHVRVHRSESYCVMICLHKYRPGAINIVVVILLLPMISTVVLIVLIQSHNS